MEQLFQYIIDKAIKEGATDIHFHNQDSYKVLFRVHTHLMTQHLLNNDEGKRLINYIKYISKIDMNQPFKPQTGTIDYDYQSNYIPLRVSYIPLRNEESLVIRILNNQEFLSIEDLTPFLPVQVFLKSILNQRQGLFIISGPTGVGKSTTLYSLLHTLAKEYQLNIITIEDPIEIISPEFTQIQIDPTLGINYEDTLMQILRHDPDVIMIGEIRNALSAKLMIDCALTGHLVLTTLHSSSCLTSLKRLEQLDVSLVDLEDVLIGLMNQRMHYSTKKNKLYCLYEFADRCSVSNYFKNHELKCFSYDECTQLARLYQFL